MISRCILCQQGVPVSGITTVTLERGDVTVVIESVPAMVCPNCGEGYVSEKVTQILLQHAEEVMRSGAKTDISRFGSIDSQGI